VFRTAFCRFRFSFTVVSPLELTIAKTLFHAGVSVRQQVSQSGHISTTRNSVGSLCHPAFSCPFSKSLFVCRVTHHKSLRLPLSVSAHSLESRLFACVLSLIQTNTIVFCCVRIRPTSLQRRSVRLVPIGFVCCITSSATPAVTW
jgi:hypothetical protein